jgi:hypothetical protein
VDGAKAIITERAKTVMEALADPVPHQRRANVTNTVSVRVFKNDVGSEGRDELMQGLGGGYPAFGARLEGEAGKERLSFVALNEAREILGQGDNGRPARRDTAECEWNAVEAASLNKGGVAVGGASAVGPDVIADFLCGCEVHFEERKGLGEERETVQRLEAEWVWVGGDR